MQSDERVNVPIDRIEPGCIVDHEVYSGNIKLMSPGLKVTQAMINQLKERGIRTIQVSPASKLADYSGGMPPQDKLTEVLSNGQFLESHGLKLAVPNEFLERATDQLEDFFSEIELGQAVDIGQVRPMIMELVSHLVDNPKGAVKLLDLDRFDRYTYRHSLNVGLLFYLVAKEYVASREQIEDLVLGATLHDLGKTRVGGAIINKPGRLDDDEIAVMRKHPLWSVEMLTPCDVSQEVISIAGCHHERPDGRGYPYGYSGERLDRFAKLSAVCDVYDALTTKRSYKEKMGYAFAIDIIIRSCGSQFDPEAANLFIRRVGRYPVGSVVMLSAGERALVIRVNENAISRPVVSIIMDAESTVVHEGSEIDLMRQPELQITGIVAIRDELSKDDGTSMTVK